MYIMDQIIKSEINVVSQYFMIPSWIQKDKFNSGTTKQIKI